MSLSEKITNDLKEALKARDTFCVSCLRMLKATIKNRKIEKREDLKDDEIMGVISSQIRGCKEAADDFRKGGREDLAIKEENEVRILYRYLPEQLKPDEIEKILKETITELSANNLSDLGKVMKAGMVKMGGKAQGKLVNEIAKKLLS